jgi:two-component system, OmpR family, alkaline phosphatase synthesis response regulator PhoP
VNNIYQLNKILVADDDEQFIGIIKDMLVPNGYDVLTARSGTEAITLARNEQPRMILMEIFMPGIDGYTACSLLKSDDRTKRIPIVILTAIDYELNKKLAGKFNADGYMVKPVSHDDLLDAVSRFM